MKKLLSVVCAGLFGFCSLSAQEGAKVVAVEPQFSDLCDALATTLDLRVFRFDLKAFLQETYTVGLYIDEYKNGQPQRRIRTMKLGKNIESLADLPEHLRESYRQDKQIPEGENEWNNIGELLLYLTKPNDSTAMVTVNVPGVMKGRHFLNLNPVEGTKRIYYQVRPFSFDETEPADLLTIPLLLYGSAWMDHEHRIMRFCGETHIDPAMKAQMLPHLPHYYIIGVEFRKENVSSGR